MRRFSLLIVLLLFSRPAWATTYYVSSAGSDSNAGTSTGASWKTLEKVHDVIAEGTITTGDTVALNKGDTWEDSFGSDTFALNSATGITLTAYGSGANPIVYGDNHSKTWSASGTTHVWQMDTGNLNVWGANDVFQDGTALTYHRIVTPSDLASGEYGTVAASDHVLYIRTTDDADPATHTVQVFDPNILTVDDKGDGLTVNGIDFNGAHDCIGQLGADTVTVENLSVSNCLRFGIYDSNGGDTFTVTHVNVTTTGASAYYFRSGAILSTHGYLGYSTLTSAANTLVDSIDTVANSVGGDKTGVGVESCRDMVIEYTRFVSGGSVDLYQDSRSIIRYNVIRSPIPNLGAGGGNLTCGFGTDGAGTQIYGNYCDLRVAAAGAFRGSGTLTWITGGAGDGETGGISIHNNVIIGLRSWAHNMGTTGADGKISLSKNVYSFDRYSASWDFTNNTSAPSFTSAGNTIYYPAGANDLIAVWKGTSYSTWTDYQAASGDTSALVRKDGGQ